MNTRKLLIPTLVALTLPLGGMASHGGKHFEQGFYFGGAAGLSKLTAEIDQTLFGSSVVVTTGISYLAGDFDASFDVVTDRGMGQIQAGYAVAWEWLFVGLEVSVNGSQLSADHYNTATTELFAGPPIFDGYEGLIPSVNSHTNIELNNFEPVADLKLGFTLPTRTYLYARVGAAFNTIELHETVSFDQFFFSPEEQGLPRTELFSQYFRVSESESVVGFRVGAGIEHRFFDRVSVALDYVHTDYGDVSVSHFEDSIIPFDSQRSDMLQYGASDDVDLTRDVVTLGVNYYFW